MSPGRRQAIIWTIAGIYIIRTSGTNDIEVLSDIYSFSFKKMHVKMSSAKRWQFSLGLNLLNPTELCCFMVLCKFYMSIQLYVTSNKVVWYLIRLVSFNLIWNNRSLQHYDMVIPKLGWFCVWTRPVGDERRRYKVKLSLIGRTHTRNHPCKVTSNSLWQCTFLVDVCICWRYRLLPFPIMSEVGRVLFCKLQIWLYVGMFDIHTCSCRSQKILYW